MEYDNTNSGMMARNDNKQSDTHPDFKGTANIGGFEYWVSAWVREGKAGGKMAGKKFFRMTYKLKEGQDLKAKPEPPPEVQVEVFDDDIPF